MKLATFILVILLPILGWLTHVIYSLLHGLWGFLIAGALLFPVGIIHGWMIWLGLGAGA